MSEHIKHIFEDGELQEDSVVRFYRTVQTEGSHTVEHYNLDMVLTPDYRPSGAVRAEQPSSGGKSRLSVAA
jgi:hypothetical protein